MLTVEQWPIDKLIPYARNPRKNDEQVDRMVSAIKEFGFRIPIVARSDGSVVDGHLRLKAAKKMGMSEVPVALADELTPSQVKAFRLLANQSANWAEWDTELLKLELEELKADGYDMELTGFDEGELLELDDGTGGDTGEDDGKYTDKVATPIYEPTGAEVSLADCADATHMEALLRKIDASNITPAEKTFLRHAATRHIAFNYQNIAEYYAGKASKEMQELMEESALVIIDMDRAIELGFVELSDKIKQIMGKGEGHDAT